MFNSSVNNLLLKLIKKKPIFLLTSLILSLSSTILNLISTTLLIPVLFILLGNVEQVSIWNRFYLIHYLFKLLEDYSAKYQLLIAIIIIFLMILLKNLINYLSILLGFKYTKELVYALKIEGLEILGKVDLDYYQKNKVGSILLKLNREIERTVLATKSLQNILIISFTILLLTVLLIFISWQLSLIALISISLILYLNNWLVNLLKRSRVLTSEKNQVSNRQLVEFLSGIRLIKSVANESVASKAIARSIRDKDRQQLITQSISATIKPITEIGGTLIVIILGISSYYLYSLPISQIAPIILVYLVVLFRLLPFISQFNSAKLQFINARSSVEIVANFLQEIERSTFSSGKQIFSNLESGIEFQSVTFAYPRHAYIVLDKINLWVPQGKTTALVGFIGSGKSTIADLLTRFYAPIEGKILLDGVELESYDSSSLRKAIAVVSRNTFLFNNSLAYNISYGVNSATEKDIIAAAKQAQIYRFISELPAGLATEVGERGIVLTELQKLQISIARAFLRQPQILILDEPVEVDDYSLSLELIQDIIAKLYCNASCTTLIVTKRLEIAKKADRIIVFNRSRIVEAGTHEKLLQQEGIYQRLYSMQFKNSQQSRQLKLAHKIAQKLAQHTNSSLSSEISSNLNALLNHLELVNESLFDDDQEQNKILDQSYQLAKDMLISLREYRGQIFQEYDQKDTQDT